MVRKQKKKLTLVIDPRFSGGTSAAVAREIYCLADDYTLSVACITSALFRGQKVHEAIARACEETGTPLQWDPPIVSAEIVALHNPSFLKFDQHLSTRIICDRLFVVCHENLIRPNGPESFDVAHCLALISGQTIARRKFLAPVSGWNRHCAVTWLRDNPGQWALAPEDWTNICDFDHLPPNPQPRDRRGRHSRAGIEKFPDMSVMATLYPPHAEAVRLLGADSLITGDCPPHWEVLPFGAEAVESFLRSIDFFVYYTHPFLQESFGRVIAEAMAAGKVVITNAGTGATFGDGVIAATPEEVDAIIARLVADPAAYVAQARRGQAALKPFGAEGFRNRLADLLDHTSPTRGEINRTEDIYAFL